jgi:hypothetical protein
MTNAKTTAAKLAPAVLIVLPLLLLLLPGVRTDVVAVPGMAWNSIATAYDWVIGTFVAVFSWIF